MYFAIKVVLYYNKGDHVYILRYCWNWSFSSRTLSSKAATRLANAKNVLCCSRMIRAISTIKHHQFLASQSILVSISYLVVYDFHAWTMIRLLVRFPISKWISLTFILWSFSFPTLPRQYFCKCPIAVVMNKPSWRNNYVKEKSLVNHNRPSFGSQKDTTTYSSSVP